MLVTSIDSFSPLYVTSPKLDDHCGRPSDKIKYVNIMLCEAPVAVVSHFSHHMRLSITTQVRTSLQQVVQHGPHLPSTTCLSDLRKESCEVLPG
ncbi:hypothetical protein RRG08_012030 [Elysia crispata]|uniref:Uncharacterized protein n=1 Tax=Elysia crispata TaxID=231223 RepID=A0AAE0XV80_9GAST|nr:hypothetical protein RRG08_012030 [Elysia crispata]